MKIFSKHFLLKILKITGITIASILLLLFLLPILFPGTIGEKVKNFANERLKGELNFSKVRLSFFSHFPSFTVSLYDFSLKGSAPFTKDTLVASQEIAFGINLESIVFDKNIRVDKIFISDAFINIQVNAKGEANYNVYTPPSVTSEQANDTASTALKLEMIKIINSQLVYNDKSVELLINARGLNYTGNGDLSKAVFDLRSDVKIDSFDLSFAGEPYLTNKKVNGELITKVNTNSLAFIFEKNKLLINKLPVEVSGKLNFLKNGYDLDFIVSSLKSDLNDFVTALPPQYVTWQQKAVIKGSTDILLTLKGQYIASTNSMPDLAFNMKIRDGNVAYEKAPFPVSNIFLNLQTKLPAINTDSLQVKVDSIFFNVGKDYFSAIIQSRGLDKPFISANVNAAMDLEKMDQAMGLKNVDLKGKCDLHLTANGLYATGPNPGSLRHEKVILSIPSFQLKSIVKDGYFKYAALPQAVSNINFTADASCSNNDYRNAGFSITNLSANALNNFIKGNASVSSLKDMNVAVDVEANINLADIKTIYPIDGLDLRGALKTIIKSKGKYDAAVKKFPLTTADFQLNNGFIKTAYCPSPITNIVVKATANDADGTLKTLQVNIQPASFQFENKPFQVSAALQNFENIAYAVKANGEIDLAKIYKVFSRKGLDISGFIKANLSASGRQSDAMTQQYGLLKNEGTLELRDIKTTSEYFPQPFTIKEGVFTFSQDKMWFKNFDAVYGQSDFNMNGYLQNVINYALTDKAVLKGSFKLQSRYINIDEFMAFAPASIDTATSIAAVPSSETGVIIIPSNLDLILDANINKASFSGLELEKGKGSINISNGKILLKQTGFSLIGCDVLMDAGYTSVSPVKADFEYHVKATDFDIHRAYHEIKIFHDMATAAGNAEGIISLDYNLKGKLDANMKPIYPSLEGGGVLSVKQVKLKGYKLLSAVSKTTGKDSVASPDISKVDIKTTIKNNLITIERFKIKMAGFRLRTEGQTSLDGKLNLKMRLGLPPLGIIGIPLKVTGTQENPKIKMGKNKEELQETEYKDE